FEKEFDEDLYVIAFAIKEFGLPETLKLSVHSGSDKFSIYPIIKQLIAKHDAGLHVKTAGTTWLEEVIGLAEADGDALTIAKEIYAGAHGRFDALTAPYATVIDIDQAILPTPEEVNGWTSQQYVNALRHDLSCPEYNLHLRQLIHVGFKIAAEMNDRYTDALKTNEAIIARNVTENLWARHIQPIFG
ncbi:MAG: tagaturonate epimerase family protein, partial [Lentimonas sp.]